MSVQDSAGLSPSTRVVSLGRPAHQPGAAVNPSVTFTSTYLADGDVSYARVDNPSWSGLEAVLGDLEGGRALAFASGMAAISAVLAQVPHGGVVVAPHHAYSGTTGLLDDLANSGAIQLRRVDISDTSEVVAALDGADALVAESPTNPMLEVADLPTLIEAAHERGAWVMCDNTFATPLLQQPLSMGADVVVHSVTKYLAGHSDLVMGATVTPKTESGERFGEQLHTHRSSRGAIPGPMETWLALRGIRTLSLRVERAGENAQAIAAGVADHPAVTRVRYPGFGAIVGIEVIGGAAGAESVCAATSLWTHSTSLGGVESQIERRRRHAAEVHTVPEELIRLSVGIESADDLLRDLIAALDAIQP
ncbi:PLP-dependent aspartate aminotransferase family protein [Ornithinimicrobium sp. INDO-MA30-4]|uniref:trans-sulfuration enzyme family protein n=1 Tax=Ornithinimicrobium sp. INDO-MA30-4 TaxID=2908651 RepID=UPI001F2C9568|nr:PLP-dependent aspartate aminotransferase family protein [Ornithinimicrobium sp. INDO-MA30-4]UJH70272.1 PLP-dependent aspartate aminotransferase family protein [Ornithinimicrobium sp. INDO-MA30-4]